MTLILYVFWISYIGAATLQAHLIEHSYSKPLKEPIKIPPKHKAVYTRKTSTILSAAGDIKDVYESLLHLPAVSPPKSSLSKGKKPKKPTTGAIVKVVHEKTVVAKAVIMEGTLLHGKEIPDGFVKLTIKEMCDENLEIPLQFKGPFDDDDDYLMSGLITAWKLDLIN